VTRELVWVVPPALRPALAKEYGPVYSGTEADQRIRHLATFGACGDLVTRRSIELGNPPVVGIVDFKTQRGEAVDPGAFATLVARGRRRLTNPPGMLTDRLRRAVKELLAVGGGLLEVDGEEDLGALALVESLPAGATVIYGIPGAGVSFVAVDAIAKESVRGLVAQMERRMVDLGA
jgi:uncharacterized protein (UPF0218 family)